MTAIDDSVVDPAETVQLTAITSTGTTYDPSVSSILTIQDNDQASQTAPVSIVTLNNAAEAGPTNGVFRITRANSNTDAALSVMLRVAGTATYGADYTLPTTPSDRKITVTIPAGEQSTLLNVTPIDDSVVDPGETVQITAISSANTTYDPSVSATLTIEDNDQAEHNPPVANANGSYRVTEGRSETLHGSATASGGATVTAYQWDFNYDGETFNVDATGATPKFSAAALDGTKSGVVRTIALRVLDSRSTLSNVSTTTIRIVNAPPTARLVGGTVRSGSAGVLTFIEVHDVPADVSAGFVYLYDFNNDGVTDLATKKSKAVVPASYLTAAGSHTERASIRDKDDGISSYTATVIVKSGDAHPQSLPQFSSVEVSQGQAGHKVDDSDDSALLDLI